MSDEEDYNSEEDVDYVPSGKYSVEPFHAIKVAWSVRISPKTLYSLYFLKLV